MVQETTFAKNEEAVAITAICVDFLA